MTAPTPSPYLYACFPLQEYFVNKDTGFPLAGGWVEFFSDEAFTVPKDVYTYSLSGGQWNEVNIGSTLVLSLVGTFQYSNADIIPFLFPYTGTIANPGTYEPYFIRVWSGDPSVQGSVLQFTRSGWPPDLSQNSNAIDNFDNSNNGISNPEFSIVNFTVDPATGVFTIPQTVTSIEIAPGWRITRGGTGDIKIKQVLITANFSASPSYALEIDVPITATSVKLIQRLNKSPRVYYGQYVSMSINALSFGLTSKPVKVTYTPNSGQAHVIADGATTSNDQFSLITGVNNASVKIDGTVNTSNPTVGYVDIVIDVPTSSLMQYSSMCLVTVPSATSLVAEVPSTNAEQTNATFWYYKPELEYKPIPSYTLGWDFAMNPFQAQGTSAVTYSPTAPGKAAYIADQTILFQSTVNRIRASQVAGTLNLEVVNGNTSFALVQYLGPNEAMELLNNPVCSQLRAKIDSGTLVGQVNLYYTTAVTLPSLSGDSIVGGDCLVTAVSTTTAAPTLSAGWTAVPRSNLSTAYFTLSSTMSDFNFSGWSASVTNAKFFAVVISFAEAAQNRTIQVQHCSLQKGYIPTAPAALSFGETLSGLQQYYEKSYNVEVLPKTTALYGSYAYVAYLVGGVSPNPQFALAVTYKVSKRAAPTFVPIPTTYSNMGILSSNTGAYSTVYEQGITDRPVVEVISRKNNFWFTVDAASVSLHKLIEFEFVADARFGVQN